MTGSSSEPPIGLNTHASSDEVRRGNSPSALHGLVVVLVLVSTLLVWSGARVYLAKGGPWLRQLTEQNGELAAARARACVRSGDVDEAIVAYTAAVTYRFDDPQQRVWALQDLGELQVQRGRYAEAAEAAREAIATNPDDLKSYRIQSDALIQMGRDRDALDVEHARYTVAARNNNHSIQRQALLRIAQINTRLGDPMQALAELEQAYTGFPDDAVALECATRLAAAGRKGEARTYLDHIIQGKRPEYAAEAQQLKDRIDRELHSAQ